MKPILSFSLSLLNLAVYAEQTLHTPKPLFFEDNQTNSQIGRDFAKKRENPPARQVESVEQAGDENSLEALINRALVTKQWAALDGYLARYAQQAQFDQTLYRYAKGASLRAQNQLAEAIALYQQIVAENPPLAYPRFDLGVMLFENKQYKQAKAELLRAFPQLSPPLQQLVIRYLAEMETRQSWQPNVELQYVRTSNVNNASYEREVYLGGLRFVKDEDSLPQSAHGVRFDLGARREWNVSGNHFGVLDLNYNGVRYWDNQDYNEQSLRFATGYRNHNALRSWGLVPFVEQNWLGSARYSLNFGATAEFRQRFNPKWQFVSAFTHQQKRYFDNRTAARHNGFIYSLSLGLNWQISARWLAFTRLDGNHDHSRDKAESSQRLGVNFGIVYATPNWGTQLSVRQAWRHFAAENFYTGFHRHDREQQFNAALWHNKIAWKGFMPQLNYRYQRVLSNIPQFYSRSSGEWFVTVEKQF